jgi:hypothetical protein
MMTEKQLIANLQKLNQIKPNQDWVILAKNQILGIEPVKEERTMGILEILPSLFKQKKLAYAFATMFLVMFGVFGFAQYTLPGDMLFTVKKITEQSQAALVGADVLKNSMDVLDKRSQELVKAVKENKENNIPSAISEVKQGIADATKNITDALKENPESLKELAVEVRKIEDNKEQLRALGIDISATENVDLYQMLDDQEIASLEASTLTEEQQTALAEIKALYEEGSYLEAFEKILLISK